MEFNYFNLSIFIGGVIALFSSLLVYLKNKKGKLGQRWLWYNIAVAIWSFGYFTMISTDNKNVAWISNLILHSAAIFIPTFFLHFVIILVKEIDKYKKLLYLSYFISLIFFVINPTKLFIKDVVPKYIFNYVCDAGPLYIFFALYFWLWIILSTIILFKTFKNKSGIIANQLKFILLAEIGFIGGGSVFFLTFNVQIPPYPIILFSLYPLVITYAILRHRLMDISIIIRKTTVYFFTIILYLSIILLAIYITAAIGDIEVNWAIVWMAFFVAAILLAFFDKIKKFFTRLANRYFFNDIIDYQKTITNLAKLLPQEIKLNRVVDLIVDNLMNAMKLNRAGVLLLDNKTSKYEIIKTTGFNKKNGISLITNTFLINYLKNHKQLVAAQELEFLKEAAKTKKERVELEKLAKDMNHIEAGLCLPLFSANNLIGVIILGNKISNDAYSKEDFEMLEIVINQASIAIENARLYKEVQDFNRNLQKKVNKQTKDIKDKTKRLRKLLIMRSEFLNITSHQLRTPVSAIKGVLSMMQEGSIPKERQKEFLNSAFQRTVKLNEIINDILDASAIDSGKFEIKFYPISVEPTLKEIYKEKNQDNLDLNKKIKLILDLPKKPLPAVLSNEKYLRHILLNLINNAFQYTVKGSIIIKAEVEKDKVIIKIIDTGIGIDKKDIPKLFQKFGRAKNAISIYTDGSGLGLFIIKKIISKHKGAKVYIEKTEINKGSVFVLELPIAK